MIRSPGEALSIAFWMLLLTPVAVTWVGPLPPIVTVTASIDCLPLPDVITSWPHLAGVGGVPVGGFGFGPPYWNCCWIGQFIPAGDSTAVGTEAVIVVSFQPVTVSRRATPSAPTRATVPPVPKP